MHKLVKLVELVKLVKLVKLAKLVKLVSVYVFDILTSKKARNPHFFTLLTWKCVSRHSGMHNLDSWTSKSGTNMWCFYHFDLEMCFASQQRALFQHLNFQKWSEPGVLCTF